jgi:hypothetical protein
VCDPRFECSTFRIIVTALSPRQLARCKKKKKKKTLKPLNRFRLIFVQTVFILKLSQEILHIFTSNFLKCIIPQICHEGVWGSGCIGPHFLDLGTTWGWVVSFTPPSLYPRGKSPRSLLDRRLDGPQSRSGRRGEEKILDPTATRTPTPRSSSP